MVGDAGWWVVWTVEQEQPLKDLLALESILVGH
jgi:hypothetical protein